MGFGTATHLLGVRQDDPPAQRRKPRMFASENPTSSPETPYTLDFCLWLNRNFDGLVEARNNYLLFEFATW